MDMDDLDSLLEDLNDNNNNNNNNNSNGSKKQQSSKIDLDELDDLMNDLNNESETSSNIYQDEQDDFDLNDNHNNNHNNNNNDVGDELDDLLEGLSSLNDPPPKPTKQPVKQQPPTKQPTKVSQGIKKTPAKQQPPKQETMDSTLDDLDLLVEGLNTNSSRITSTSTNSQPSNNNKSLDTLDELDELMNGLDGPPTKQRQSQLPPKKEPARNSQVPMKNQNQTRNSQVPMKQQQNNTSDDLDDLLQDMDNLSNAPPPNRNSQFGNNNNNNNNRPSQSYGGDDDLDDLLQDMDINTNNRPSQNNSSPQTQTRNSNTNFNNQRPSQNNQFTSMNNQRPSQNNFSPQTQTRNSNTNFNNQRPSQNNQFNNNSNQTDELDDLLSGMDDFTTTRGSNKPPPQQQNFQNRNTNNNMGGGGFNNQTFNSQNRPQNMNVVPNGPSRGVCGGCNQQIYGQVLQALGRSWHPEHFVCGNCSSELGTASFYEQEGKPHCENCYQQLFCPRCAACDQPITSRIITALGKKWHPEHFVCTTCNASFGGGSFYERGGYPYCQEHYYNSSSATKCAGCNNIIQGDCVNAIGQQWHSSCFNCQYCHKSFNNGQFYEMNGMPYCEIHYYSNTGSMCAACSKPITGKAVNALGKSWHPEHFVCGFCYNSIGGGNFTEKEGKAYCSECYQRLYS